MVTKATNKRGLQVMRTYLKKVRATSLVELLKTCDVKAVEKTVNIILKHVYNENQVQIALKKRSLKKLILNSCMKTTFS